MEECLAIKPDLVFLWDEAWFAFARFHPVYRNRTAMTAARNLRDKLCDKNYKRQFEATLAADAKRPPTDDELLNRRLMPDPAKARVRVYATQSTHKTLTSLRQGSMIHVFDQDFDAEGRRAVPRGLHGPHVDVAELPDPGVARPRAAVRSPWKASSSSSARSRTPCNCGTRSTTTRC